MATIGTEPLTAKVSTAKTAMHWIGGEWLGSGAHRHSVNPATGEAIGSYLKGGRKEAELAVNAALQAFNISYGGLSADSVWLVLGNPQRREDIPLLTCCFVQKHARRWGGTSKRFLRLRCRRSPAMIGPVTSGNCRTSLSGR